MQIRLASEVHKRDSYSDQWACNRLLVKHRTPVEMNRFEYEPKRKPAVDFSMSIRPLLNFPAQAIPLFANMNIT